MIKKEPIEISLTDFIGFVNKSGNSKQTLVRQIKYREEYETYKDFYKPIRERIIELHKKGQKKDFLDDILIGLTDDRKNNNYPQVIAGYKKFLGKKNFEWIKPIKKIWKIQNISISINPEIGLEEKKKDGTSNFYIIKLYFKDERIQKSHVDQILTLMEMQLRDKVKEKEVNFALLDIRRGKLHTKNDRELKERPLLEGEAMSFSTIWNYI